MKCYSKVVLASILALSSVSCGGGGGGGGNFSGAADIRVNAEPRVIDSGDRIQVKVTLSEIHENGVALKVRFSSELAYVPDSAEIEASGDEFAIVPTNNQSDAEGSYLVFYLIEDDFGREKQGDVVFELVGNDTVEEGLIEVDADVDDPQVDNSIEFNVEAPEFGAEDAVQVIVEE